MNFLPNTRFWALLPAVLLMLSCTTKIPDDSDQGHPNILFIIMEDMNTDLNSYGGPVISPHIDRLAAGGLQFNHAYVQQPVCAASRSSFLTGLRPDVTGVDYPYSHYFVEDLLPEKGALSRFFMEKGYHVQQFGKAHHGMDDEAPAYHPLGKGKYISDSITESVAGGGPKPPHEKFSGGDHLHVDFMVADSAARAIRAAAGQEKPFFYIAGFSKPHLVFAAPDKYWDLYERTSIETPVPKELAEGSPRLAVDQYYLEQYDWETDDPLIPFSDDYARMIRHAYYASSSFVDAQAGLILDALKESGLEEETIVLLISDHGFLMGGQNYWGKTNLFEKGLRIPMFLSWKGHIEAGIKSDALVEAVDIFPTLADLAGFELPDYLEGTSLKPLIKNPERPWKKGALSQQPRGLSGDMEGYSIRTDRYRYTEWIDKDKNKVLARELFDYEKDPTESRNLASAPEYAGLIPELSLLLNGGWKALLPDGIDNHSENAPAPPSYAWGPEGLSRRAAWHAKYGGREEDGWRKATELRATIEANETDIQ